MNSAVCTSAIMQTFAFVVLRHQSLLLSTCARFLSQSRYSAAVAQPWRSVCQSSSVNVCEGCTAPLPPSLPQLSLLPQLVIVLCQSFMVKCSDAAALHTLVVAGTVPSPGLFLILCCSFPGSRLRQTHSNVCFAAQARKPGLNPNLTSREKRDVSLN